MIYFKARIYINYYNFFFFLFFALSSSISFFLCACTLTMFYTWNEDQEIVANTVNNNYYCYMYSEFKQTRKENSTKQIPKLC